MADMDQGIKRLIQLHPADILALAVPDAEYLGTLPVDVVTEPQLMLDTLLRVRYHGIECAIDLEAEARPKRDIGRRLFEYGTRARLVTGLPVISVVLWLEADGAPPPSPYVERVDDLPLSAWHFIGIEVYRLRTEDLIQRGPLGLLPLVPFAQDGGEVANIERVAALVKERAPADELATLEGLLAVFAARSIAPQVVREILRRLQMSTEIIEQSALYQEALTKGKAEGIQQGKAEGIQQGKIEGMREAALALLQGRFGTLPPDLTQTISAASASTIVSLLPSIAIDSLEQVRARLGL